MGAGGLSLGAQGHCMGRHADVDPAQRPRLRGHERRQSAGDRSGSDVPALGVSAIEALAWFNAAPADARTRMLASAGISPDRERAALDAWKAK